MLDTIRRSSGRCLILFVSFLIVACAGQAKFKPTEKAAGYDKSIDSKILVVFEISHLSKAFVEGGFAIKGQSKNTPQDAANSVISQLRTELLAYGVAVEGEVVDGGSTGDRSGIARAVATYPSTQQILIINTDAFQSTQLMRYGQAVGPKTWSGKVSWSLAMFDKSAVSITGGKTAWSGKTEMVNFSPVQCGNDQFKLCADRFVTNIIYQLRTDGLIRKVS
jgi:hypothetical protein